MPFVSDIYPPAEKMEAVAGLGLAVTARRGKGFPGRRQYEDIELLGRFNVFLRTALWESGEEGCTVLVIDSSGLLCGTVSFDLAPGEPQAYLKEDMVEEEFVVFCQQLTKAAVNFSPEVVEIPGLITDPEQLRPFLYEYNRNELDIALEKAVDSEKVVQDLKRRLTDYDSSAAEWSHLRQKLYVFRDRQVFKINEAADAAKTASNKFLEELKGQVQYAIAARSREIDAEKEIFRGEHKKKKELYQSELARFHRQFKEEGGEYWREKIKVEEQGLYENDKWLNKNLDQLNNMEKKFVESQQERITLFKEEREKRFAVFEQRLKRLDMVLTGLEKAVDKRLEYYREQQNRVTGLVVSLAPEQCEKEFPVVFFAARYSGGRWQVFPPQVFGHRGIKGKFAGLIGDTNLPFRTAGKVVEELAERIQALLPGHGLETRLEEQNLLNNHAFISEANNGLAELIDQGEVAKKHAGLFDGF